MRDNSFLTFNLHGMLFAINAAAVTGVIRLPELTLVEERPSCITGIINMHGDIVPVMDLLVRFGHNPRRYNCSDKVIIISLSGLKTTSGNDQYDLSGAHGSSIDMIGIIANEVMDVLTISEKNIEPSSFEIEGKNYISRLVSSEAKSGENIFMIIESVRLFDQEIMNEELYVEENRSIEGKITEYFCPEADLEEKAIFHNRAIDIQHVPVEDDAEGLKPVAVFSLNNEYLCVELQDVRGFSRIHNLTHMPCCPGHIAGNMNLRGAVLTMIDISGFLNLKACRITELTKVIVADSGEFPVGVMADEILDVIYLKACDIVPVPHSIKKLNEKFIKGAAPYNNRMMAILDFKEILSWEFLVVNEEV